MTKRPDPGTKPGSGREVSLAYAEDVRRVAEIVGGTLLLVLGILGVVIGIGMIATGGEELLTRRVSSSVDAMDGTGFMILFFLVAGIAVWFGVVLVRGDR